MTIYFIDEDHPVLQSWVEELRYRGFVVKCVSDADRGYTILQHATDVEWVIIDVMLAAGEMEETRYPEERTEQGLVSGVTLLKDLCLCRPDMFPRLAHLLTAATGASAYFAASKCAEEFSVPLTRKADVQSPREFGDIVVAEMRGAI